MSVYVVFTVGLMDTDPEVPFVPDQPPDAVQVVALVVDQFSDAGLPEVIEVGEAEIVTVATGL